MELTCNSLIIFLFKNTYVLVKDGSIHLSKVFKAF